MAKDKWPVEIGGRVGVISGDQTEFWGFGVLESIEEAKVSLNGVIHKSQSPKIRLDNGNVVMGYECWWDSAEKMSQKLGVKDEKGKKS